MKYSIVLPCKDEDKTIAECIRKIRKTLRYENSDYEIIVVDNNSRDNSARIAKKSGAIVIKENVQGYGAALRKGFSVAKGQYVIMADADNTYDFEELPNLLKYKNYDIVIGNRFNKRMETGAMPVLHKYIGNPLLSLILRTFFKTRTKDTHSGFRVIKKSALDRMHLNSKGMELASEMLLKAARLKLRIKEVPISYYRREGDSKLNSFSDGWKHIRLMLLYSPNYLYLVPGVSMLIIGVLIMLLMLSGPVRLYGFTFYIHPIFIGSLLTILGYQILLLWLFSKTYMITYLEDKDNLVTKILGFLSLEKGMVIGLAAIIVGLGINIFLLVKWIYSNFGSLDNIGTTVLGLTIIILGIQTIFSSFYLSILGIKNEQ